MIQLIITTTELRILLFLREEIAERGRRSARIRIINLDNNEVI